MPAIVEKNRQPRLVVAEQRDPRGDEFLGEQRMFDVGGACEREQRARGGDVMHLVEHQPVRGSDAPQEQHFRHQPEQYRDEQRAGTTGHPRPPNRWRASVIARRDGYQLPSLILPAAPPRACWWRLGRGGDPWGMAPVGSYVAITVPAAVTLWSVIFSAPAGVPSPNSRFPCRV